LEKLDRENRHLKKDLDNFSGFETEEMKVITETVHDAVYLESYALSIEENDEQVAHLWKKLRHYSK
jgi:hypothetical protein